MPVKVKCSGCQAVLNAPDRARGKAVKCPKCGTGIRIPAEAPAKRKPANVAAADEDHDFFSALDVNRLEDRSTRVCPKCGTIVGAEDVDCPMCGADLATGGLGMAQRARVGRKGAAPSEYYGKALKDGLKYLGKKQSLAWKSAFIFAFFGTLSLLCYYMFVWCYNDPPKAFWAFVGAVVGLTLPGWIWYVQLELIQRALAPKRDKDPVRFESFASVSLGIKSIAWSLFYGWPIWLLFGVPGALMTAFGSDTGPILLLVGLGLFLPVALVSWPVAQANFAMPITFPGWMIHKVFQDVGRNVGPVLYWATFAVLTAIPVAGIAVGGVMLAMQGATQLDATFRENSRIGEAQQAVELAEEEGDEPPPEEVTALASQELKEIDWKLLLWPVGGIALVSIPLGFYTVYNARTAAYFVKLFRPNLLNLVGHEKEYVYRPKTAEDKENEAKLAGPYTPYAVQMTFVVAAFVAAVGGAGLGLAGLGYGMGFWLSCLIVSAVTNLMWWPFVVYKGFKESIGWGIGMLLPCVGGFVTLAFLGSFQERTKYESQILGISVLFWIISLVLEYTVVDDGGGMEEAAVSVVRVFFC